MPVKLDFRSPAELLRTFVVEQFAMPRLLTSARRMPSDVNASNILLHFSGRRNKKKTRPQTVAS